MPARRAQFRLANVPLTLTTDASPEALDQALALITERLERIEDESEIVDTQRFALQAAVELALQLIHERALRDQDEREVARRLDAVAETLRNLERELPE